MLSSDGCFYAGYEVISRMRNDSKVLIAPMLLSVVSGFALYKYAVDSCKSCAFELTWAVIFARLAWGAFQVLRKVVDNISD